MPSEMRSSDLESGFVLTHMNNMPWGWILELLLDVKQLSPLFLKDFIGYFPHLEQPECSRLVQKLVLRYLDEVAGTRELDTCDALLVKCFLKEQGASNLRSDIHSLKESFAHDLTIRVETEAVLTNLRSYCKDGRRDDLAAYEDAVDKVFSEDILEPRGVERRNELTAVLPDRSNGESEKDLREQLLGKYSLEELCGDLGRFVDDKKKQFNFKFLDQLANDVENGVYSSSPGSDLPETQTPSKMHTDFCDKFQFQDSLSTGKERTVRKTSDHPSSDWPSITKPLRENKLTCKAENGDSDPQNGVSGVNVSEPKDGKAEVSSRMAEVASGTSGMYKRVNDMANFTEFVSEDIQVSTLNLRNQLTSSLSVPLAGNPVLMQETFTVLCPPKRGNVDLEMDEPVEDGRENTESTEHPRIESLNHCREADNLSQPTSASIAPTSSLVSPENRAKSSAVEILDQVPGLAKKRKFDVDEDLSKEKKIQSGATGENIEIRLRPIVQQHLEEGRSKARLSTDNDENLTMTGVHENCDIIGKEVEKSCSERTSKHIQMRDNDGVLTSGQLNLPASGGDGELHPQCCFQAVCHRCFVSTPESCLSKLCIGQEEHFWYCLACAATMAQDVLRKAEEDEKKAKEAVRKAQRQVLVIQNKVCRQSLSARRELPKEQPKADNVSDNVSVEFNKEAFRDPEGEDRAILVTARQAAVLSEELCATRGNDVPGPDFTREANVEEGPTFAPSLPVIQALDPIVKHTFEYCDNEQSGSSGSSKGGVPPMSNSSPIKSRPHNGVSEDVRATNTSEVSMSLRGDSIRSSGPLSIRRIPEGEEGDGHDGDLEEVCEGSVAAAQRTNVEEKAAELVPKRLLEASNVEAKSRRPQAYRGRSKIPGVRRQSLPWTRIEEDVLKEGVRMFSNNGEWGFQWKRIHDYGAGKFHESRTKVDLKDKWRNMIKGLSK